MKNKKLSIIVPIFNSEKTLNRCLFSLCNQSYTNLEIILIDDGSTDSSVSICQQFAKNDKRIIFLSQSNKGVSSARNFGLKYVSGEFVTFVDSDDYLELCAYEMLLNQINDCDAIYYGFYESYEYAGIKKVISPKQIGVMNSKDALYLCFLPYSYCTTVWNKIFRSCKIKDVLFDTSIYLAEDDEWISRVSKNLDRVFLCNKPLYYYVQKNVGFAHSDCEVSSGWISAIEAKIKIAKSFSPDDICFGISRAKAYNDLSFLRWNSYINNDHQSFLFVSKKINPFQKFFFFSSEYGLFRKIKFFLLNLLISLRAPKKIVSYLSNSTIYRIINRI